MCKDELDDYLYTVRQPSKLRTFAEVYEEVRRIVNPNSFSPFFVRILSYTISRVSLFEYLGHIPLSSALTPTVPSEHYAYSLFSPLLLFLGCKLDDEVIALGLQHCSERFLNKNERTQPLDEATQSPIQSSLTPLDRYLADLAEGIPVSYPTRDDDHILSSHNDGSSEDSEEGQGSGTRSRVLSITDLQLQHLRNSIPRLKKTRYACLYLLHAPSRPPTCPITVLLEGPDSNGIGTLLKTICHHVSDLHSHIVDPATFATVYSTVIGEKHRLSMSRRALQMQCCSQTLDTALTTERVLSTVQESRRIIRKFTLEEHRRARQKVDMWGAKKRRASKPPTGDIIRALTQAQSSKYGNPKNLSENTLRDTVPSTTDTTQSSEDGKNQMFTAQPSSHNEGSPPRSFSAYDDDALLKYFTQMNMQQDTHLTPKWDPLGLIDFSMIQHNMDTFDLCGEISFSLGSIHKESSTEVAKRSILIGYNDPHFSYRRQLMRARLFYNVMLNSPTYKLNSDKYYYQNLNDCMDLHIDQVTVEKRISHPAKLSLLVVLCGHQLQESVLTTPQPELNETKHNVLTQTKQSSKKPTKEKLQSSIMYQVSKALQKPAKPIEQTTTVAEPSRKQDASLSSLNNMLALFHSSNTESQQHFKKLDNQCLIFNEYGKRKTEFVLIHEKFDEERRDISFISVPLCEIAPFNCSHLFSLRSVAPYMRKLKSTACEAMVLAYYNIHSWKLSKEACASRPAIRQLAHLMQFWDRPANMPPALSQSQFCYFNTLYNQVVEICSSLCNGFLSLSRKSYLSLYAATEGVDSCVVMIDSFLGGEELATAVRYTLLPRRNTRKWYQIDYICDRWPVSSMIADLLFYIEKSSKTEAKLFEPYNSYPDLELKGLINDVLLGNNELWSRRTVDLVQMAVQLVADGAHTSIFQGLNSI